MLKSFDDKRSKSFYCLSAALFSTADLEESIKKAEQKIKENRIRLDDVKTRSKILKQFLNNFAAEKGFELELRKK